MAGAVVLVGLCWLGWLFLPEIRAAAAVWRGSTAYTHCFVVLPIVGFLAYDRRARVRGLCVRPLPGLALLALPLALLWLAAELLGLMEARQFIALAYVELLIVAVFGWSFLRAYAVPLGYLVFLVPAGAFLTAPLQDFTARFIVVGLNLLHIPNYADAHVIEIPEGAFYVAEACAGLRFLVASVAFGAMYAATLFRTPGRRLIIMLIAVVMPIIANGIRALGIVLAGHWVGSAAAVAADHIIYGWGFFSFVLVLLIMAGAPFRQDRGQVERAVVATASTHTLSLVPILGVALVVGLLAALGPVVAGVFDRAAMERVAGPASLPGCRAETGGMEPASQTLLSGTGAAATAFVCADGAVHALVVAFPPRTNPARILAMQRSLTAQDVAEDAAVTPMPGGGWQSVVTIDPPHVFATALWIDGRPGGGLRNRVALALRSFARHDPPLILAVLAPEHGGRAMLEAFIGDASGAAIAPALAQFSADASGGR